MAQPAEHSPARFLRIIQALIRPIDLLTEWLGRVCAWLTFLMALATITVVVMRRGLGLNSIALQESSIYMHSAVFLLGAAYALKQNGHVRVDIFYRRMSPLARAWIDGLGGLIFLLPLCGFIFFISWDFVASAWRIRESSPEPGGIPAVYLLKTLILLGSASLALQGLAQVLRSLHTLMSGQADDKTAEPA